MQLDNARIVIRERLFIDILDLALQVVNRFKQGLFWAWLAGVLPAMALNTFLLWPLIDSDWELGFPLPVMILMPLLVFWEAPLATAAMTLYLGQALFSERTQARKVAAELAGSLPQLIVYQVFLRLPLVIWPYLNEVILLERNPMRAAHYRGTSTVRRCGELHGAEAGSVFLRTLVSLIIGLIASAALWISLAVVQSLLFHEEIFNSPVFIFWYQLVLWIVVGYFTVVNFLAYLDLRIRTEGWEVEVAMKAEGAKLARRPG